MARHHRGKRHYSQADVYSIARSEGASDHEARFLAGVVPPESGGDAWVVNSIGATGLVQIYDGHFPSPQRIKFLQNPRNNIREGLHKLRTQGPGAWAASRSGWRPFHGRGSGATGGAGGSAGGTLTTPGRQDVALSRQTTFDRAGFEKARKLALVGQLIARRKGTDSPLFKTGLLTTQAPAQGDFMNTRLVSKVVSHGGSSIPLAGAGGGGAGGYVHPHPGARQGRTDQGVDFTGQGRILAIGRAKILASTSAASGWPEGGWVSYKLLDGPERGRVVYVAEGIHPHVRPGQIVRAGQQIASFHGSSIETGWGTNTAFRTLAAARGHVAAGSHHSPEGEHFKRFLNRLYRRRH